MANCIIVLGATGSGKSTSLKGLDPHSTVVFNTLRKRLPFKGSNGMYNAENKNLFEVDNFIKCIELLNNINSKAPHVKNIVIDDAIYYMRKEFFDRAKDKGYDKFTDIAMHFQNIIETCEMMRPDLNVFFLMHSEPIFSDNIITGYKVATVGKLLDDKYNPLEVVPMVLFSNVQFKENKPQYGFFTHATMDKGAVIPAKSPEGMFEEDFIANDLSVVVKAMDAYYN